MERIELEAAYDEGILAAQEYASMINGTHCVTCWLLINGMCTASHCPRRTHGRTVKV